MHLRHLIVLIISARNKPAPLEKAGPSSDQERKPHPKGHGHLIGQIKKNQISRAMLSLSGVRIKQAAAHLFTMSIDPATSRPKGQEQPNLLSIATLSAASKENGGAGRDRTDDLKLAKLPLSQLSYGPIPKSLVGPGRLELPTSRLSGVRSNHLSYGPSGSRQKNQLIPANASADRVNNVACEERETKAAKFRSMPP